MAPSGPSFNPPRGMRDFYPDEMGSLNAVFNAWHSSAKRFGFSEYGSCVVESLDLLKRKAGEEIAEQLYAFKDKSNRDLALRAEMTPSLARMVAARQKSLTLGVVESATGGLISHLITNIAGSSDYYRGSITAYSNEVKIKAVGVKEVTVNQYGAVSPQVAEEMAHGGRRILAVDICLADTGIAGPGGATPGKPVGLFYIGLSHTDGTDSRKHNFGGDREQNKRDAAGAALSWLKEYLINLK